MVSSVVDLKTQTKVEQDEVNTNALALLDEMRKMVEAGEVAAMGFVIAKEDGGVWNAYTPSDHHHALTASAVRFVARLVRE